NLGIGVQHDARLAQRLMQRLAQDLFDVLRRQGRDGRAREFPRNGECDQRGFLAHLVARAVRACDHGFHGLGEPGDFLRLGFRGAHLARLQSLFARARRDRVDLVHRVGALLARARGVGDEVALGAELGVEGVFGRRCHQYTSSSSPCLLAIMISPLLARSLATLTMRICASSTSLRRTGPIASMSSRRILPARSLMLEKNTSRRLSVEPLSASASLSFSTWRSSVWIEPGSSLPRSSKVNISALMRSAESRLRSSSAVTKRLSVWRSKLLKISAMCSCASRLAVRARFDMNSTRSVCSTLSRISF